MKRTLPISFCNRLNHCLGMGLFLVSACMAVAATSIVTWGNNDAVQTNVPSGLTDAVAVSCGKYFALALKANGTVAAWGADSFGYGETNVPAGLSNVVAISAGERHAVALKSDGTIVTWGIDLMTNYPCHHTNAIAVAAGMDYTLVLTRDGRVDVLGNGPYGYARTGMPADLTNVVGIAASSMHCLAVKQDGSVVTWGNRFWGYMDAPAFTNAVAADAGESSSTVLCRDGTVVRWGPFPYPPSGPQVLEHDAVAIGSGWYRDLVLRRAGTLRVAGLYGDDTSMPAGSRYVAVAAGYNFYVALQNDGSPFITLQPRDRTAYTGDEVVLTVLAAGGWEYQWRKDGTNISGATGRDLVLPHLGLADAGRYSVVVSNVLGSVVSREAQLCILEGPPLALSAPRNTAVPLRGSGRFDCAAEGSRPLSFQWRHDGEDLALATNQWLPMSNVMRRDAGLYSVVISNAFGSVTSAVGRLTPVPVHVWGNGVYNATTNLSAELSNTVSVALGYNHVIALKRYGTVFGWGYNDCGQATPPDGLSNVVAVAAGAISSVALLRDGRVVRWGWDWGAPPEGFSNIVSISAAGNHVLGLRADGALLKWGYLYSTGEGEAEVPAQLAGPAALASGASHDIILRPDGTLASWGQLATDDDESYYHAYVPSELQDVAAVAAGYSFNVALKKDRSVVAWGRNNAGQTRILPRLTNVVAVAAGLDHALALLADGTLCGWGNNDYGQADPAGLTSVTAIFAGEQISVALLEEGAPFVMSPMVNRVVPSGTSWVLEANVTGAQPLSYQWQCNGTNIPAATNATFNSAGASAAQAGDYGFIVWNRFGTQVTAFASVTITDCAPSVAASPEPLVSLLGGRATFQARVAGSEPMQFQWQHNGLDIIGATNATLVLPQVTVASAGDYCVQIGNAFGSAQSSNALLQVSPGLGWGSPSFSFIDPDLEEPPLSPSSPIIALAHGDYHCAVLRGRGTVEVLGTCYYGQCFIPGDLTNAIAIDSGPFHILALTSDGRVVAWGATNNSGPILTAVPANLTNVVAVSAGGIFSLALRGNGTVVAWGDSYCDVTNVPPGLSNVSAISAGNAHALALRRDGSVVAWGWSEEGMEVPPEAVNITAIAAGSEHNLALRADGTVLAWGLNQAGECDVPAGLSNVVAVAAGAAFSVALRADGTVATWGAPWQNQLETPAGITNAISISAGHWSASVLGCYAPALRARSLVEPRLTTNGFEVCLPTLSGRTYALEYKASLEDSTWTPLPLRPGTGKTLILRDPSPAAHRFYRARQW